MAVTEATSETETEIEPFEDTPMFRILGEEEFSTEEAAGNGIWVYNDGNESFPYAFGVMRGGNYRPVTVDWENERIRFVPIQEE